MSKHPLSPTQPRYLQIARSLLAELESGRYPIGSKIPNELDLCKEFGASRFTVRAAIDQLAQAGFVSRKTGVGTTVIGLEARPRGEVGVGSLEDIHQFSARTVMNVLKTELVAIPVDAPAPLDAHAGQTWLYVEGLRTALKSPDPLCFNEIWIGPDFRGVNGIQGRVTQSISMLIEEQFGVVIDSVQQDIRATVAKPAAAKALGLRRGVPSLYLRRAYYDRRGRLVQLATSWYPPDSFVYSQKIGRNAGPERGAITAG